MIKNGIVYANQVFDMSIRSKVSFRLLLTLRVVLWFGLEAETQYKSLTFFTFHRNGYLSSIPHG